MDDRWTILSKLLSKTVLGKVSNTWAVYQHYQVNLDLQRVMVATVRMLPLLLSKIVQEFGKPVRIKS